VDGPSDLVRSAGQSAALSVTVSGAGSFSYQWSKDGVNIDGADGPNYSLASVTVMDSGGYWLVVEEVAPGDQLRDATVLAQPP